MQRSLEAYQRSGNLSGRPAFSETSASCAHGRAAGTRRCPTTSRPARRPEDRRHGRRGPDAGQHRRDPDRPRRMGRSRIAPAGVAAFVEGVAASVLPCVLPVVLGRVSSCQGRVDEALSCLEEAKANFLHVGADEQAPLVEARIAECHVAMGNAETALELVEGMLGRARSSGGVARALPLIERVACTRAGAAGQPAWGARCAAGEPRRGPGAEAALRGRLYVAFADRARPSRGRRALRRDGDGEPRARLGPQSPGRPTVSSRRGPIPKQRAAPRGRSELPRLRVITACASKGRIRL